MNSGNEQAKAKNGTDAMISQSVSEVEQAHASGRYRAVLTGPVEHLRDEYIKLKERLTRGGIRGWFDRMLNGKQLLSALLAIPIEQKWVEEFDNIVTTVGKNAALDAFLAGSAYTVTGPYLGLCNTNASTAVIGDTMASHAGWLEVGGANAPTYTAPRKTAGWSAAAAGSKSLSAAAVFAITSSGTVGGCFLVFGAGASSTIDNTGGVLYSAGQFTGGVKTVANTDNLSVSYTASL